MSTLPQTAAPGMLQAGAQPAAGAAARRLLEEVEQAAARAERRRRRRVAASRLALVLVLLAGWELASGRLIDIFFVSRPSAIMEALWRLLMKENLLYHLQFTVLEAVLGYVAGAALGMAAGFVLARSDLLYATVQPLLAAFYGIPRIALAPLIIMWFGIGLNSKVVVAALMVFFIVLMNTIAGVRNVHPELIQIARVMGASERQILQKIVIPGAAPIIITGLQTAVPQAMIGAIVGEFISSNRGVGHVIGRAAGWFDTPGLFAGIVALLAVVLAMNGLVNLLEARAARWKGGAGLSQPS
ncbi:MAG TPA: ABC transporter permease [Limnochordales bacterium]